MKKGKMEIIETNRLKLRELNINDAKNIYTEWASDPEVSKYLTWLPHSSVKVTESLLKQWVQDYEKKDNYLYGIELKQTGVLIGTIGVVSFSGNMPVIGFVSGKKYWNRGYMTEALIAFVEYLFEKGYGTLLAEACVENIGSNCVIQKAGFQYNGCHSQALSELKPEIVRINSYSLSKPKS